MNKFVSTLILCVIAGIMTGITVAISGVESWWLMGTIIFIQNTCGFMVGTIYEREKNQNIVSDFEKDIQL